MGVTFYFLLHDDDYIASINRTLKYFGKWFPGTIKNLGLFHKINLLYNLESSFKTLVEASFLFMVQGDLHYMEMQQSCRF